MLTKKRVLATLLVFSLTLVAVACAGDDDQELINQTLDTFEAGIEAGDAEQIETVLTEEVTELSIDQVMSGEEFATEMAGLKELFARGYSEDVIFSFELRDRELEEIEDQSTTQVKLTLYAALREDLEALGQEIMAELEEFSAEEYEEEGFNPDKIRQGAEALIEGEVDQAEEYFLEAGLTAEEIEQTFNYRSEEEEGVIGLVKDDGVWYINEVE